MTVSKLITVLRKMPPDMEITAYSDIECVGFDIQHVKRKDDTVYIGEFNEEYPILQTELQTEVDNSKGKLQYIWHRINLGIGFFHNNVNGQRVSIIPSFSDTILSETVMFKIEENGKVSYPNNFAEVKAFIEKYVDCLMEGVDWNPKQYQ